MQPIKEALMDDKRKAQIESDQEKLERAAEPHDWMEEAVDSAVEGLISPLTHDPDTADGRFEQEPDLDAKERQREEGETEERLNEGW
jgi:hypothetical protein